MEETLRQVMYFIKWIMLIPLVVGVSRWSKLGISQRLLVALALISFITEILAYLFIGWQGNNMAVYQVYTLFEFSMLIMVFHFGYRNFLSKNVAITIISLFAVVLGWEMWATKMKEFNSITTTLEGIVLIGVSIIFFVASLRRLDIPSLNEHPIFWVGSGLLIYFTANLLLFAYHEFLLEIRNNSESGGVSYNELWVIHGILNVFLFLFYTRSLLCPWKESK